jgi:two-component system sensor histidine kinase/response regulator
VKGIEAGSRLLGAGERASIWSLYPNRRWTQGMTPSERSPSTARSLPVESLREQRAAVRELPRRRRSRAALEREVERLSARVIQLERQRSAAQGFAAVAAHELLEPLVMIEAYVAMVSESLDEQVHPEALSDLDALGRGAARARLLVETLLHDARASERRLRRTEVDLDAVVRNCLSMLAPELKARRARVEVEKLPRVSGEEVLLGGLFTNLLMNALKYGPRDSGTIRVAARRADSEWELWVDSEGPTIAPADRGRIFQPFHRGTAERRANGTGLGLAVCRSIVERHGGRIGVTASNGSGNRFYFTLPVVEAPAS